MSGSGKKLWKQKGTGRARMGSIRSPLWRHGGTVHGPVPRVYAYKLPRKMQLGRAALGSVGEAPRRRTEGRPDASILADHKTKSLAHGLKALEAARKVLLVDVLPHAHEAAELSVDRKLVLGSRNLEGVKLVPTREVTVYDLLNHKQVSYGSGRAEALGGACRMNVYDVIVRPIVTEKAVIKKDEASTLCFEVAPDANKTRSKLRFRRCSSVKVADVQTINNLGKLRRRGRFSGYRSDWKKAYVRLKAGEKMPEYTEI